MQRLLAAADIGHVFRSSSTTPQNDVGCVFARARKDRGKAQFWQVDAREKTFSFTQ
jgi:hypothetical protein